MDHSRKMALVSAVSRLFTLAVPALLLAGDASVEANAEKFKILTLIPPVVAIVLAFVTRNVVLSLFAGIFSGTFMLSLEGGVVAAFQDGFIQLNRD